MKKIKYSSNDFSASSLPQKRIDVLRDVYKVRLSLIIRCGLTLLLFALPLIASTIFMDIWRFGTNGYNSDQLEGFYFYWNILQRLLIIPSLYILLIGVSGILRIFKLLIWQEGIDFHYDFKLGIKENYKQMIIPSFVLTTIYLIYYCVFNLIITSFLMYVTLAFICLIFVTSYLWYISLSNVYQARPKELFSNSLFFLGKTILKSVLFMILIIWPFFYEYFQIPFSVLTVIIKPIAISLLLIFYYPFLIVVMLLFTNSEFDKHINCKAYPDLYRKGLYVPEKEEDIY